jgi:hypothetical protein
MLGPLLELLSLTGLLFALAVLARVLIVQQQEANRQTYVVRYPRAVTSEQVENFLLAFAGRAAGRDSLVFEVTATAGSIQHRLRIPLRSVEFVQAQLRTAIPGVRLTPVEEGQQSLAVSRAWSLLLTRHAVPLNTDQPDALAAALLGSLNPLGSGETLVVQWVISPKRVRLAKPRRPKAEHTAFGQTADLLRGVQRVAEPERRQQAKKLSGPLFAACVRLGVSTPQPRHRTKQLLARPYAVLRGLRVPGVDLWPIPASRGLLARRLNFGRVPLLFWPVTINAAELAPVLGLPLGEGVVPGLAPASAVQLPPSPYLPWRGLPLGMATFASHERPVAISMTDATKHLHIMAPTGGGKSTLLQHIFRSVVEQGYGGLVIDPKGDLISAILNSLPAGRERDVILLDPLDARPPGLNLLDCPNPADRELIVDGIVTAFRNRFKDSWGPRLEDCLRMSVSTLMDVPNSTLLHVERLLTDPAARARVMGYLRDETLLRYWHWFGSLNARAQAEVAAPVLNKLRGTLHRPSVARMVGAPSTFHFDDILRERKLLLVNVPHGLLGPDTAAVIGSLVYQQAWAAIQRRARLPQAQRTPFVMVLDEFQQFVAGDSTFGDSLALARGYGAPIICAHQHLSQLSPELRDAVLANARTKLCFALNAHDARIMAREFGPPITPADLQQLDPYEALVSPHVGSQQLPPVNVATPPPLASTGRAEAIRGLSRERYGVPAATTPGEPVEGEVIGSQAIGRRRL